MKRRKPPTGEAFKPDPPLTDAAIALGFTKAGPYHWQAKLEQGNGPPVVVDYYPTTSKLVMEGQTYVLSWRLAARHVTQRARQLKGL